MKDLNGEDLWSFLCNTSEGKAKHTRAVSKAEKRRRKKEEAAKAFSRMKEELHEAYQALDLWVPVAVVQVFYQTRCTHCGERSVQPELHLSQNPLIRLRHKRTGEFKSTRLPWNEVPKGLGRTITFIPAETTHCLSCAEVYVDYEHSEHNPQLELPLWRQ
jgi:hypothetical protein